MAASTTGQCPNCESLGPLGVPCGERICARQGIYTIPPEAARKALLEPAGQREPLIGQLVGDYLIIGRLGKGGFGKVLLGLQRPLHKLKAAIKLVEFAGSDERVHQRVAAKFETEAAALAVLQSPHIVRLLQYGVHHGQPFMAMEFVPGSRTLQTEINRMVLGHEAMQRDVIQRVVDQTLNGLDAAHREGIIHRDIKPENIMLQDVVGDPWFVKLVDFGLAKVVEESRETSLVLGTVHYMAPEQIEAKNLGAWTDLYAVGVIAFELLIGQRPFAGKDTQLILRDKLNASYDPLARVAHLELPDAVSTFFRKALHRYPDKRFRSAAEFRDAWAKLFELTHGAPAYTNDLSSLVESADISDLRRMESSLLRQREQLEAERRALEAERRQLESERIRAGSGQVRASSSDLGSPAAVESWAIGQTQSISNAVHRDALTQAVPAGSVILGLGPSGVYQTGHPQTAAVSPAEPSDTRRKSWRWVGLALLVTAIAGVVVFLTLSDRSDPAASPTSEADSRARSEAVLAKIETAPRPSEPAPLEPTPPAPSRAVGLDLDSTAPSVDTQVSADLAPVASTPRKTSLEITSDPSGAKVYVDGELVGVTPFTLETRLGARHKIELEVPGRPRETREVEVVTEVVRLEVPIRAEAPAPAAPTGTRPRPRPATSSQQPRPLATEPASPEPKPGMQPIYVDDP